MPVTALELSVRSELVAIGYPDLCVDYSIWLTVTKILLGVHQSNGGHLIIIVFFVAEHLGVDDLVLVLALWLVGIVD